MVDKDLDALMNLLFAVRADGTRRWDDGVLRKLVPLLHLLSGAPVPQSAALAAELADFTAAAALEPRHGSTQVEAALQRWANANALPADLVSELRQFFIAQRTFDGRAAAERFAGRQPAALAATPADKPAGSLRAGPLARFIAPNVVFSPRGASR